MKKFVTILGIFSWSISFCQNVNPLLQSPNAASLGVYDKIDVSPFTGLANISIPVFSISEGDITISSNLQYYSGGVKPDQHPGWVGTNWSLNTGGQVTRKKNGDNDEFTSYDLSPVNRKSYYQNNTLLAPNDWSSVNKMKNHFDPSTGLKAKAEPDEFMFSLPNGISGSFFYNHLGEWVVKSKSTGGIKVNVELNSLPVELINSNNSAKKITLNTIFYKIVITDPNGFRYTFGNNVNSIEFNRSTTNPSSFNENVVATTWNLTKIESPKGHQIVFNYVRKDNQYHINGMYPYNIDGTANCGGGSVAATRAASTPPYSGYVITPSFLSQIVTTNATVDFQISESVELKYDFNKFRFQSFEQQDLDYEINSQGGNSVIFLTGKAKYYKLDHIVIKNQDQVEINKYSFNYSSDPSKRLTLNFFRSGSQTSNGEKEYIFTYNTTSLPVYNSFTVDKWGYFNNNPFNFSSPPQNEQLAIPYLEMNPTVARAGILTKIKYPTGGETQFVYEPNTYSSVLKKTNNSIVLVNESGEGGGLRIKEVISNSLAGVPITKKYYYAKSTNPSQSSGILAGLSRIYTEIKMGVSPNPHANIAELNYSDSRALNYTDGKEIVYSEIKEELADGSYTIYKYSNSDNPIYKDKVPLNVYSEFSKYDGVTIFYPSSYSNPNLRHISMDLERGNLISKILYKSDGVKVSESQYSYNSNPSRFNNAVRFLHLYQNQYTCNNQPFNVVYILENYMQATIEYTYFPYLEKEVNFLYAPNGIDYQRTETNFEYESQKYQLIKKTVSTSNSSVLETVYKHPLDFATTSPYNEMVNRNMLAPIVEQIQNRKTGVSSNELNRSKTNYQYFNGTSLIEPASVFTSVAGVTPMTQETVLSSYDSKGNLKEYVGKDGVRVSYLWGYAGQYPVAKIVGKTYDEVITQTGINASNLNNSVVDAFIKAELMKLNLLNNCFVSSFLYKPNIGISKQTDNNGKSIYYEYDGQNRLILIRDNDLNVLKKFCYNYYDQLEDCVPSTGCSTTSPIWQNTGLTRCQTNTSCGYTGIQELEQEDINTCSSSFGSKKWVAGANSANCATSVYTQFNVVNNTGQTGWVVKLIQVAPILGATNTYTIPLGSSTITCVLTGKTNKYNVEVIRQTGQPFFTSFTLNGITVSGTTVMFNNISFFSNFLTPSTNTLILDVGIE